MPRVGLTRGGVVRIALDTVDDIGGESLTLAEVATRARVKVPSLYKHIASLEMLRVAVATATLRELAAELRRAALGVSRADALTRLCHAYRGYALRHPGRYGMTRRAVLPGGDDDALVAAGIEVQEVVSAALRGYAIVDDDALIDATRALRASLDGFCMLENGGGFALARSVEGSFAQLVDGLDRMLATWPTETDLPHES